MWENLKIDIASAVTTGCMFTIGFFIGEEIARGIVAIVDTVREKKEEKELAEKIS